MVHVDTRMPLYIGGRHHLGIQVLQDILNKVQSEVVGSKGVHLPGSNLYANKALQWL